MLHLKHIQCSYLLNCPVSNPATIIPSKERWMREWQKACVTAEISCVCVMSWSVCTTLLGTIGQLSSPISNTAFSVHSDLMREWAIPSNDYYINYIALYWYLIRECVETGEGDNWKEGRVGSQVNVRDLSLIACLFNVHWMHWQALWPSDLQAFTPAWERRAKPLWEGIVLELNYI